VSRWPDHQALPRSLDYFSRYYLKIVDLQDAIDLAEQALDQAEVPARDPDDRGHRLGVAGVVRLK
jgi:hypothetical protein